jgi:hypothetical protein
LVLAALFIGVTVSGVLAALADPSPHDRGTCRQTALTFEARGRSSPEQSPTSPDCSP